jgi:hypothetical protein
MNIGTYGRANEYVYCFYIIMLLAMIIGYLPAFLYKYPVKYYRLKKRNILTGSYYIIVIILIILILHSSFIKLGFYNYFWEVRVLNNRNVLKISVFSENIIKVFLVPMIHISIIIFLSHNYKYRYIYASVPILLYSLFFQTNYMIIYLFLIACLIMIEGKINYVFLATLLIILLLIAFVRAGRTDIFAVIQRYFIDYFTLGFNILSYLLEYENSYMNKHTFGMSFLVPLDQIISRTFNVDSPIWFNNQIMLMEKFPLTNNPLYQPNAFGTIGFILYKDFGLGGAILGGLSVGFAFFILNINNTPIKKMSSYYFAYYVLISVMVPPVIQLWFWMGLVYLIILSCLQRSFYEEI